MIKKYDVVIVGGGFTGLSAAYYLSKKGKKVKLIEKEKYLGGLAGSFDFKNKVKVEKFYHHWFTSDNYVLDLIKDLKLTSKITENPGNTGLYFNHKVWDFSNPLDLLKFKPLSFFNRIRLGLSIYYIRSIKDWKKIEHLNIEEWLTPIVGKQVFKIIWKPLVDRKFADYANDISAAWIWKRLIIRGSSRKKLAKETLLYFQGGFDCLIEKIKESIVSNGGSIETSVNVKSIDFNDKSINSIVTSKGKIYGDKYLLTCAYPIINQFFKMAKHKKWLEKINSIKYIGNICLVLQLKKSLSSTYWLNVNDSNFPFVGVIEHTNFDTDSDFKGSKIVYLSRYLSVKDKDWSLTNKEYFLSSIRHLQDMFPKFSEDWVIDYKIWKADYAQPITSKNYSKIIPNYFTPFSNLQIANMAQVYPEDRGTNYAVREGKKISQNL